MPDAIVAAEVLHDFLRRAYAALGLPEADAEKCASQMLDAELRGVKSHGCVRFGVFAERLRKGTVNPRPEVKTLSDLPGYALLDGDMGMSAVVARQAVEAAMDKAAKNGIGAAGIRRTSHTGHIGYFAAMMLQQNMIGIIISGAAANLAPWGGRGRMLGNSPIAFAIPSRQEFPIIFDMATSKVARGYVLLAAKAGEDIPEGWALDPEGNPTTDAALAAKGTMLPLGDHKGYGLSLMFSFLTAALTGNGFDADQPDWVDADQPFSLPLLAIAIDPTQSLGENYKGAVDETVRRLKASERAGGFDEIRIPGEASHRRYKESLARGVALKGPLFEELARIASELGIAPLPSG
ncbi:MAG: Ldh family oxidoreductase [bacterium]|nr:Ldh family oxidoreductase [bacterium]